MVCKVEFYHKVIDVLRFKKVFKHKITVLLILCTNLGFENILNKIVWIICVYPLSYLGKLLQCNVYNMCSCYYISKRHFIVYAFIPIKSFRSFFSHTIINIECLH